MKKKRQGLVFISTLLLAAFSLQVFCGFACGVAQAKESLAPLSSTQKAVSTKPCHQETKPATEDQSSQHDCAQGCELSLWAPSSMTWDLKSLVTLEFISHEPIRLIDLAFTSQANSFIAVADSPPQRPIYIILHSLII